MELSVKYTRIIVAYSMLYSKRFEFETEEIDGTTEGLRYHYFVSSGKS